jgi:hypothetical protein
LALKRASKPLNVGPTNGTLPSLRLDVDRFEAQLVFSNQAVDALVASTSNNQPRILLRATVPHRGEDVDDELLERSRRQCDDTFTQVCCQRRPQLAVTLLDEIVGRAIIGGND